MRKGNTKERLIMAALDLFSVKGYEGTTVEEVAANVGIKAPTLYKYLKSKSDLLQTLLDKTDEAYSLTMEQVMNEAEKVHSGKDLKEFAMHTVQSTLNNEQAVKMRKVISIEQFRDQTFAERATLLHITKMCSVYTDLFSRLMEEGVMLQGEPDIFAMEFISPTTLLIHMCDRQPEKKEETIQTIERLVDSYIERHCLK